MKTIKDRKDVEEKFLNFNQLYAYLARHRFDESNYHSVE